MARVILTVPHAKCRSEDDKILHKCDLVAERIAYKIFDFLTDKGHKVMLRVADINRTDVDYNRPEGRETAFRRNLEKDFPKADFLFDIHSYPRREGSWDEDIVLLKWLEGTQDNRSWVYDLLNRLARLDLNVAVTHAARENDIVSHALENNLPAILIEFSEVSVAADEKSLVSRFCEAANDFLKAVPVRLPEKKMSELLGFMLEAN